MADTNYKTVLGEAFNIKQSDKVAGRSFAVRRLQDGVIANCTLWDSSHEHVALENGDIVIVNGKYTTPPKSDGSGHWNNISVGKIVVFRMDSGFDTRSESPASVGAASDDEPDVL